MRRLTLTESQRAELLRRYPHESTAAISADMGIPVSKLYAHAARLGVKKTPEYFSQHAAGRLQSGTPFGVSHRFFKGQASWNKGLHYSPGGRSVETRFKKGNMSGAAQHNYLPIGTLRVNTDGYLERKTTDDPSLAPARRWIPIHRLVWIAAYGQVPSGYIVVFKPGLRSAVLDEITLDKVELISRAENMKRNTLHRYPKEVVSAMRLHASLNRQINNKEHTK